MYPYFDKLFSKFQCGFRKGFNAQHFLTTMIEKWQRSVHGGRQTGALLTDLSKASDCIDHELVIAKLYAYGFDKNSLYFILGPLLFNICICDLFIENSDIVIANYANDNTPYACSSDLDSVIFKLQKNTERIFR